jgi:hypothetical protein
MHYNSGKEHVNTIMAVWKTRIVPKYHQGQAEHGGKLWRKPVLDAITDEIADLMVYWDVQLEQFEEVGLALSGALQNLDQDHGAYPFVKEAINLLSYGNREGEMEEDLDG